MLVALLLTLLAPQQPEASQREMPEDLAPAGSRLKPFRLQKQIDERVRKQGVEADTVDLRERLAKLAARGDGSRLEAVCLPLREPWLLPDLVEHYAERFEEEEPWKMSVARDLLDTQTEEDPPALDTVDRVILGVGSAEGFVAWIEERLADANRQVEVALARLSPAERDHVASHWQDLSHRFEEDIYLYTDEDQERRLRNLETIRIGESVDRDALLTATSIAFQIELAAAFLPGVAEAEGLDLAKPVLFDRSTPYGRILVAGTGNDWHRSGDVAVLIDLGGDDFYSNNVASTVGQAEDPALAVSVFVDHEGNDAYEATHEGAMGFGLLGVGLLVDRAGDDSYVGLRWTQGAGYMGVGMLIDHAGDDRYRCHALSQGVGLWGFGMLEDHGGDDRYEGHNLAQAVGMAGGAGVLHDGDGDDEYYCKGTYPTGYGTEGVFEGWGQGCGVGFRQDASGGFALLLDGGGADRYEAGNFSQGGGYYYGLGALIDRGKADDVYIGSRYDQGFSAHQAVGYFHEEGGDDSYTTRNAVAHGLAWDECVTVFVDDAGNDTYKGGGFSLGASAHNAIAVFWDKKGKDTYLWDQLGNAGPNDYHGGTSLSFFLDEGGAKDEYRDPSRNGAERYAEAHGFFVDR